VCRWVNQSCCFQQDVYIILSLYQTGLTAGKVYIRSVGNVFFFIPKKIVKNNYIRNTKCNFHYADRPAHFMFFGPAHRELSRSFLWPVRAWRRQWKLKSKWDQKMSDFFPNSWKKFQRKLYYKKYTVFACTRFSHTLRWNITEEDTNLEDQVPSFNYRLIHLQTEDKYIWLKRLSGHKYKRYFCSISVFSDFCARCLLRTSQLS